MAVAGRGAASVRKEELRELAVERIKANREICKEEGFKERMEGAPATIWIDLLTDL